MSSRLRRLIAAGELEGTSLEGSARAWQSSADKISIAGKTQAITRQITSNISGDA